jgi:hypothetical protein
MNKKRYFVALIVLNTVLLAFAASLDYQRRTQSQYASSTPKAPALSGPSGKFGPVIETVLPSDKNDTLTDILDLETGIGLRPPTLDYFNSRADAMMAWIRSNGLDISCSPCAGCPACITYDMTVVPVAAKYWQKATEQDLLDNPALAPVPHSPRRMLVMRDDRLDTYMFRTGEGTLGILQLIGADEHGHGVKVRYKLINPTKAVVAKSLGTHPENEALIVSIPRL